MKKLRNKILSAVLVLSLLLTSSSFAFAVGGDGTENTDSEVKITRSEITALTPSSQQSGAGSTIENAFDGTQTGSTDGTIWHTAWTTDNDTTVATGFKRSVKIELNEAQWVSKMIYYPRGGSNNGKFKVCKIYVSEDGESWGDPIASSGTWEWQTDETNKTLSFDPVYTKYLLIYAEKTYGDTINVFASAAEIELYKDMSKYPTITKQPVSTISSNPVTLSVEATASEGASGLTYQWYSYTEDISGAKEVSGGTSASITVNPTATMTYYFVKVTQTVAENTTSINSNPAYVKLSGESSELTQINRDNGLSIIDYSSEASAQPHNMAIDGQKIHQKNVFNFWETNWNIDDNERYMTFDLGSLYNLSKVTYYYARGDESNGNGVPVDLEVWTSTDNKDWILSEVQHIDRSSDGVYDIAIFLEPSVNARYVKLHPKDNVVQRGDTFAIGEAEFFVDLSNETLITQQPVFGEDGQITIGTASGASIQWYKNSTASYEGAVAVSGATNTTLTPSKAESAYYFAKVTKGENNSVFSEMVYVQSEEAMIERDGGNYYGPLSEAIENADSDETIQVLRNIDLNSSLNIDKKLTIKSAGETSFIIKRASGCTNNMFSINANGNLTFDNIIVDGGFTWQNGTPIENQNGSGVTDTASSMIKLADNNSQFTLKENSVLQNNKATNSAGGAVLCDLQSGNSQTKPTINIYGTIQNCAVTRSTDGNGGAIASSDIVNIYPTAVIKNNYCFGQGGAIQIFRNGKVTISGSIDGNKAGVGGAVAFSAITMNIEDTAEIKNNIADTDGGALYITGGTSNINKANISKNSANWGGAIYIGGGTTNFTDTIITENRARSGCGGAFNVNKNNAIVNINSDTKISNNTATQNGGAVNIQDGTVNINGGLISENTATQNGGAIYLGNSTSSNGTLNLGSSGNDFALTISGNTAENGNGIYYGENGTMNINAKLNLYDKVYLHTNGLPFNVNCDLEGNSPISIVAARPLTKTVKVDSSNADSALSVLKVIEHRPSGSIVYNVATYFSSDGNIYIQNPKVMDISRELSESVYFRDINNDIYKVTGSENITYTWYVKNADSNEFTKAGSDLNTLSDGTYTVYCVASDDTNYMVSDVAEITVKDFYPCSKAIDKFKNI